MRKLVVFDLDGTLLNTVGDLGNAVNHAMSLKGYPMHTPEEYKRMVGHGVRNLVSQALPQGCEADVDSALEDFFTYYREHLYDCTVPYAGMIGMVSRLHEEGCPIAVASNKFQDGTERLIRHFFPCIPFVAILGNRPGMPLKPSPEIVREAMEACGEDIPAVMVGDAGSDILTARAAGIPSIAVSWGFRAREELSGADHIADTAEELYELLLSADE